MVKWVVAGWVVGYVVGGWVAVGRVVFVSSALAFKGFSGEERDREIVYMCVHMHVERNDTCL